jgi:hypothetical protein
MNILNQIENQKPLQKTFPTQEQTRITTQQQIKCLKIKSPYYKYLH